MYYIVPFTICSALWCLYKTRTNGGWDWIEEFRFIQPVRHIRLNSHGHYNGLQGTSFFHRDAPGGGAECLTLRACGFLYVLLCPHRHARVARSTPVYRATQSEKVTADRHASTSQIHSVDGLGSFVVGMDAGMMRIS